MIKDLKEMGKVCENRKLGVLIQDFHRKRFKELFYINRKEAQVHQESYLWWTNKIAEMDKHIEQLHERIKAFSMEDCSASKN